MHIVLVHDAVIPPLRYGGTERVIYWLAKALIAEGHRVTLLCQPGSHVRGAAHIPIHAGAPWTQAVPSDTDILHLSATPSVELKFPFLVTIHGNGRPGERFHRNSVFVSRSHAANHGSLNFVHNGIDLSEYPLSTKNRDRLAFLAKASWKVKNLKGAIQVARKAELPLDVLGSRNYPFHLHQLLPFRKIRYHGMVDDSRKRELLSRARAFVFPVRWPEPFGLAVVEALAIGCPVFATPYGSLPEIVTPDCGFLSASSAEIVEALLSRQFSPESCRARVERAFTHRHMAKAYLAYYERILKHGTLSDDEPVAKFTAPPETLLPWN